MKSPESTSTALARILALPLMAGLLAGCDYASKLPDAPTSLGYELQGPKPPSVTAQTVDPMMPDPTMTVGVQPPRLGDDLNTQALQVSPQGFDGSRTALAVPPSGTLPMPGSVEAQTFGPFPAVDVDGYTAPPIDFSANTVQGGQFGVMAEAPMEITQTYEPVSFDSMAGAPMMTEPVGQAYSAVMPDMQPGITYNDGGHQCCAFVLWHEPQPGHDVFGGPGPLSWSKRCR